MADENLDQSSQDQIAAEAERRQQEELQRQAAEQARIVQQAKMQPGMFQGQPTNGNQEPQFSRGVEYSQRGLPVTNANIPTGINPADATVGVGQFIDRQGNFTGPTYSQGFATEAPRGTVGVEGQVSPQEQQWWSQNQLGAFPYQGQLIGLGNTPAQSEAARESVRSPESQAWQQTPPPDFIKVHEVNPAIQANLDSLDSQIADKENRLRSASHIAPRGQLSDYARTFAELNELGRRRSIYAMQLHQEETQRNNDVHFNTELQQKHQINVAGTAATIAMGKITAPLGSDERTKALASLPGKYEGATQDPKFYQKWQDAVGQNASHAAYTQYVKEHGLTGELAQISPEGTTIRYKPEAKINEAAMGAIDTQLKNRGYPFTAASIFNPAGGHTSDVNKPYDQLAPTDVVKVPYINKKGEVTTADVKKSDLESLKNEFNARYKAAGGTFPTAPVQQSPQGTPQPQPQQQQFSAAPTNPADRQPNNVYVTPRGNLRWTGTGWVNP